MTYENSDMSNTALIRSIKQENLISPSLMEILYGDTEELQLQTLLFSNRIAHIHSVFMLYAVLIQAYCAARAISGDPNCTIANIGFPKEAIAAIKRCWTGQANLAEENYVFSFIYEWHKVNDRDIFNLNAASQNGFSNAITSYTKIYSDYTGNTRFNPGEYLDYLSNAVYAEILRVMPLFKHCSLEEDRLVFDTPDGGISVSCIPFILHNGNTNILQNSKRNQAFILTCFKSGERNGFPLFQIHSLNGPEEKQLRIDSTSDSIRDVCRAIGVSTSWYSTYDSWCDLAYLKKVIDATVHVILSSSKIMGLKGTKKDIAPDIRLLYKGTEIETTVSEMLAGRKIYNKHDDVEYFFYEMFISVGIFNSLFGLLYDAGDGTNIPAFYGKDLFESFLDFFIESRVLPAERKDAIKKTVQRNIDAHVAKLKKICHINTPGFIMRQREIYAEWYAYEILRITGIKTQVAPFADRERMLSVDDYINMIRNPATTLEDDLKDILRLLNTIYGPLVDLGKDACEKNVDGEFKIGKGFMRAYSGKLKDYAKALRAFDTEELFDRFIKTVENSRNNPAIGKFLGRYAICSKDTVEGFKKSILSLLSQEQDRGEVRSISQCNADAPIRDKIFISYNHEDKTIVEAVVKKYFGGYDLFFDDVELLSGENWKSVVQNEMATGKYAAVVVFVGEHIADKGTIFFELLRAKERGIKILPVNLLPGGMLIWNYLQNIVDTEYNAPDRTRYDYASQLVDMPVFRTPDLTAFSPEETPQKLIPAINKIIGTRAPAIQTQSSESIGTVMPTGDYTELEQILFEFYNFLKIGYDKDDGEYVFGDGKLIESNVINRCIFPLVISVKESMIKRDKIALIGYEIIKNDPEGNFLTKTNQYILSSSKLETDDYYCIPNYKLTDVGGRWMVEPFLIKRSLLINENETEKGQRLP